MTIFLSFMANLGRALIVGFEDGILLEIRLLSVGVLSLFIVDAVWDSGEIIKRGSDRSWETAGAHMADSVCRLGRQRLAGIGGEVDGFVGTEAEIFWASDRV